MRSLIGWSWRGMIHGAVRWNSVSIATCGWIEGTNWIAEAPVPMTAGERRNSLRRQLNTLVAAHHHRTNLPHGKIHAELRRLCGGPPSAQATIEQLEERIATIQTL